MLKNIHQFEYIYMFCLNFKILDAVIFQLLDCNYKAIKKDLNSNVIEARKIRFQEMKK